MHTGELNKIATSIVHETVAQVMFIKDRFPKFVNIQTDTLFASTIQLRTPQLSALSFTKWIIRKNVDLIGLRLVYKL